MANHPLLGATACLRVGLWVVLAASTGNCQRAAPPPPPKGLPAGAGGSRAEAPVDTRQRMPEVRLAAQGPVKPVKPIYRKPYHFTEDWFSWNVPVWEKAMAPYRGKKNLRYLEVGTFEGASALWMLENILTDPSSRLTLIDPFAGDYRDVFRANLELSGAKARVAAVAGYSQLELRKIPVESCDLVYIDGSHKGADVLEDAVLVWRLVKHGGLLLFDDYRWEGWKQVEPRENRPGPALDAFYEFYGKHFEVIHNGYQIILKRK
jgi:predicted O-methyltransferase YrrM